jgi:hypothetical protein
LLRSLATMEPEVSDAFESVVWRTSPVDEATDARDALRHLADESGMAFELLELWSTDTAKLLAGANAALAAGNLGDARSAAIARRFATTPTTGIASRNT